MAISDEDIQKVREASDIVAIMGERTVLRQRGRDFWCCCPFHNEKTPSCKIDPSTQLWHCFGCGEGGDVFGFIMKSEDLSFPDAVRYLAERAQIDIKDSGRSGVSTSAKARLREVCAATDDFYHAQLMRGKSNDAAQARSYLAARGFGGAIPKKWHLGFAPGRQSLVQHLLSKGFKPDEMIAANVAVFYNRVMFPINNPQGECIAFGGRVIGEGEPKYLNSQETPLFHKSNVLYGLDKAKNAMVSTGTAIIVEGYTDVIALHESGIQNAVATLGTALTLQHVRLISRHASKRIVYLFDGDAAGQRAADNDLDPADFVAKRGADELKTLVDNAKPLIAYGIDRRLAAHDLSSAEGRTRALADALVVLAPIKKSMLAKDYAIQLAGKLMMREQDVLDALEAVQPPRAYDQREEDMPAPQGLAFDVQLPEAERSRRKFERRLLSLFAQNPVIALEHVETLVQTQWHELTHSQLAECILRILEENPAASPATIVSAVTAQYPRAAGLLTSSSFDDADNVRDIARFLVEELEIGDMEQSLAAMNAQLKSPEIVDDDERDIVFQACVELQKTIAAKRAAHGVGLTP